jgi:hypothetical protein
MQESVCAQLGSFVFLFSSSFLWTGPKNVTLMGVGQDEERTMLEGWGFVSSPDFAVPGAIEETCSQPDYSAW